MDIPELTLFGINITIELFYLILFAIIALVFLSEFYKFVRYRTRTEMLDLSLLGTIFLGMWVASNDVLLSVLTALFIMMAIGTYELRESQIWFRLMLTFTISYGYVLGAYILSLVLNEEWIFGVGISTTLWIMLIFSFIFFGKRYLLVSRFISPQYVYLVLYAIVYILILQIQGLDIGLRYILLAVANIFIYLISGVLLTFMLGVKPLNNDRVTQLINQIEEKMGIKVRFIGHMQAPILNAFAYGPWFDRRIALVVNNIDSFTDEEILGIASHELAHLKKKHTLWLLLIGIIELAIKDLLHIPASTYDYAFSEIVTMPFVDYYILNLFIFAMLVIFVRIMEGQADALTKKIGYGRELCQSLYKLEGFYQGIAGELGLDAQLLTGKERTDAEQAFFLGLAAESLYRRLICPSRSSCMLNLIVSHPMTSFRLAALVDDKISIIRIAVLPFLLLIPGLRGRNLQLLRQHADKVSEVLTSKYEKENDSINSYISITNKLEMIPLKVGQEVVFTPKYEKRNYQQGIIKSISPSSDITRPVSVNIENATSETLSAISFTDHEFIPFELGSQYLLPRQRLGRLEAVVINNNGRNLIFEFMVNQKKIKSNNTGIKADQFDVENFILLHTHGSTEMVEIAEFIPKESFSNAQLSLKHFDEKISSYTGKEVVIERDPILVEFNRKQWKKQKNILLHLQGNKVPIILYHKEDLEIGLPCIIKQVTTDNPDDKFAIEVVFANEIRKFNSNELDAIVVPHITMLYLRRELGFGSFWGMKISNFKKRIPVYYYM